MNYVQKAKAALAEKIEVEDDLLDLYTILLFVTGTGTDLIPVHDAWAIWRTKTNPNHQSVVPFSKLAPDVQELDRKYVNAIRETARAMSTS